MKTPRIDHPPVASHDDVLPPGIGLLIALGGALLCWGVLIALVLALS